MVPNIGWVILAEHEKVVISSHPDRQLDGSIVNAESLFDWNGNWSLSRQIRQDPLNDK